MSNVALLAFDLLSCLVFGSYVLMVLVAASSFSVASSSSSSSPPPPPSQIQSSLSIISLYSTQFWLAGKDGGSCNHSSASEFSVKKRRERERENLS